MSSLFTGMDSYISRGEHSKRHPLQHMPTFGNMEIPTVQISKHEIPLGDQSETFAPSGSRQSIIKASNSNHNPTVNIDWQNERFDLKNPVRRYGTTDTMAILSSDSELQMINRRSTADAIMLDSPGHSSNKRHEKTIKMKVVLAYWKQTIDDGEPYRKTRTKQEIKDYVETVLSVSQFI